ncbi:MAG: sialidase family protein [Acidobacteriota bacterium]
MISVRVLLILPLFFLLPLLDAASQPARPPGPALAASPALLSSTESPALVQTASNRPALAARGNAVAVTWAALDLAAGTARLYARVSNNSGKTWDPAVQVDTALEGPGWSSRAPAIVFEDERTLDIAWFSYRAIDRYRLLFARSVDGGRNWATSTIDQGFGINPPRLILLPDGPALLWQRSKTSDGNFDLYFARTSDQGKTWETQVVSNYATGPAFVRRTTQGKLLIATSGGTAKGGNFPVVLQSSDGGKTWIGPSLPSDVDDVFFSLGSAALDGKDQLHLAWSWYLESGAVYYDHSADGKQWHDDEILYSLPKGGVFPGLFLDPVSDVLYCAWMQTGKGERQSDLYLKRRENGAWLPADEDKAFRIDQVFRGEQNGASLNLSLHFLRKKVIALWQDSKPGLPRILLNHSVDGGRTWSRRETILDHVPARNPRKLYAAFPEAIDDGKDTLYVLYYLIDPKDPRQSRRVIAGDLFFRKVKIR